jgi:hypothetical protein
VAVIGCMAQRLGEELLAHDGGRYRRRPDAAARGARLDRAGPRRSRKAPVRDGTNPPAGGQRGRASKPAAGSTILRSPTTRTPTTSSRRRLSGRCAAATIFAPTASSRMSADPEVSRPPQAVVAGDQARRQRHPADHPAGPDGEFVPLYRTGQDLDPGRPAGAGQRH